MFLSSLTIVRSGSLMVGVMLAKQLSASVNRIFLINSSSYRYTSWYWFFLFILLGVIFQGLRNPTQIFTPTLYGEDAAWISWISIHGFAWSLINGREEYPVFLPVILNWVGWILNKLAFSKNVSQLPHFTALVSFSFFSFVCWFAANSLFKNTRCRASSITCWLLLISFPLAEANSTLGHNLQWAHLAPFLSAIICLHRIQSEPTLFTDILQFILCLTLPLCIVICALFLMCNFLYSHMYDLKLERLLKKTTWFKFIPTITNDIRLIFFVILAGIILLNMIDTSSNLSIANQAIIASKIIEFAIFRPFLFPIFASFTSHFNDSMTLCIFSLMFVFPFFWLYYKQKLSYPLVFLCLSLLVTLLIFSFVRGGIALTLDYDSAHLHFYYLSLSSFSVVILCYFISFLSKFKWYFCAILLSFHFSTNSFLIFQGMDAIPQNLSWEQSLDYSYSNSCSEVNCLNDKSRKPEYFAIPSNPSPDAWFHFPIDIVERSVQIADN